jgi:hypothetical protein
VIIIYIKNNKHNVREDTMPLMHFELKDRLRLRKPHPCGSYDWEVVRLGADIGLRCEGCGRRVLLPRSEVERRVKKVLPPLSQSNQDDQ